MTTNPLLVTESLRKEFGGLVAVDEVDFTSPLDSIVSRGNELLERFQKANKG